MKKILLTLLFLAVTAPHAGADEVLFRNGTSCRGKLVKTNDNVACFVSNGDTVSILGHKIVEMRLDNGRKVVFDAASGKFKWKNKRVNEQKLTDKTRALAIAVGFTAALIAHDNFQDTRDLDEINRKIADIGGEKTMVPPRKRFLSVFYGAVSVLSFVLAAK